MNLFSIPVEIKPRFMLENDKILANGVKYTVDKLCNNELYFSVMIGLIYCTVPLRDTN